jgi:hypothetical protein
VAWTREHGLCCLEAAAKSGAGLAAAGAEHLKTFGVAVVQCGKDIYE